jgi:hypothetical protein
MRSIFDTFERRWAGAATLAWLALGLVGLIARAYVIKHSLGCNDMTTWVDFAHLVHDHGLGYAYENEPTFNHPPLMGLMASSLLALSTRTGVRYEVLFRIPSFLADLLSAVVIHAVVRRRSPRRAAPAFALFLLNPVSIAVSAFHGNTDAICVAFTLLAAALVEGGWPAAGGLALGASMNVKLVPVLVVPLIASRLPRVRPLVRFVVGLALGAVPFVPVLVGHGESFYLHVLAYRSNHDQWGITGLLFQLSEAPHVGEIFGHLENRWLGLGTKAILACCVLLGAVNLAKRRWTSSEMVACGFAIFLFLTPGWGVQYLAYLAAPLFAVRLVPALLYSWTAGAEAALLYYTSWNGSAEPYYAWIPPRHPAGVQSLGYLTWATTLYALLVIVDLPALARTSMIQWARDSRVPGFRARALEWLFQRRAEDDSTALGDVLRDSVRRQHDQGVECWRAATRQRYGRHPESAASLYQAACVRFAHAFLLVADGGKLAVTTPPDEAFDRIERSAAARGWHPPRAFEVARRACADPAEGSGASVDALHAATRWLASLVDVRSPLEIRATRLARILIVTIVTLYSAAAVLSPKNLAAHKPVTASSVALGTSAEGAVDEDDWSAFGFHSGVEDSPQIRIDLERVFLVRRVRVIGRGDCCFDQSVPLALEASNDGVRFHEVARRTAPFGQVDPWLVAGPPFDARYVRLRTLRRSVLVLSEVQVYGDPQGP